MARPLSMLTLVALATACGAPYRPAPAFEVHGADVVVDSGAPFAARHDLRDRVTSTLAVALGYWGGDWDTLDGVTVTLTDEREVRCGDRWALGCFTPGEIRVVTGDPADGTFDCVEQTVLVHEVGHAVLGDPDHRDPRWMGFEFVAEVLAGRTGYAPDGAEVECVLHPSVWRHPLDHR
ncbi:MAG: hypothetical protein U0229_13085 [Anaeromyxobacter sp.]